MEAFVLLSLLFQRNWIMFRRFDAARDWECMWGQLLCLLLSSCSSFLSLFLSFVRFLSVCSLVLSSWSCIFAKLYQRFQFASSCASLQSVRLLVSFFFLLFLSILLENSPQLFCFFSQFQFNFYLAYLSQRSIHLHIVLSNKPSERLSMLTIYWLFVNGNSVARIVALCFPFCSMIFHSKSYT